MPLTASAGAAFVDATDADVTAVVARADARLYAAKREGATAPVPDHVRFLTRTPMPFLSRRQLFRTAAALVPFSAQLRPVTGHAQTAVRPPSGTYAIDAGWAWVAAPDDTVSLQRDVTLVIRQGRIDEIAPGAGRGLPRLDARTHLVLPGFISGHTHVASGTPTRGIIEGGRSYQRPLELLDQLSDEDLDAVTAANLAELIRSGCTTTLDMSPSLRQAESFVRVATRFRAGLPGAHDSRHAPSVRHLVSEGRLRSA